MYFLNVGSKQAINLVYIVLAIETETELPSSRNCQGKRQGPYQILLFENMSDLI